MRANGGQSSSGKIGKLEAAGQGDGKVDVIADPFEAVEVEFKEGIIVDIGIEVHAVGKALGIGGEPAAKMGSIKPAAEADEIKFCLGSFGGVSPRVERI